MAERRPKYQGLERVLGTGALFSTAYGNVGSSIYYALGLVTVFALGLTPLVFVISGLIFAATAATYAEATAMYPEAGGSSSFARHAFNEFWSFFAAWGQMLNYVITVAISAFFVPHYIGGLFWSFLKTSPGDIIFGIAVIVRLCAIIVVGGPGVRRRRLLSQAAGGLGGSRGVRGRSSARNGQPPALGRAEARRRDLRRPARGDDPVHRDQRRDHRRVETRVLDGAPPPGARPAAPAASALPNAMDRDSRLRGGGLRDADSGTGDLPREHVRVRRDVVVHDRARLRDPAASVGPRPGAAVSRPGDPAHRRAQSAAVRG